MTSVRIQGLIACCGYTVHMVPIWVPRTETQAFSHTHKHEEIWLQNMHTHAHPCRCCTHWMQSHLSRAAFFLIFFSLPLGSLYSLIPAHWLSDPTMAYSWWLLLQLIGSRSQRALIEWPWLYILCWSWTHYFNRPALITIHYKWGNRIVVFSLAANDTSPSVGWTWDCFGRTLHPGYLCCRMVVE